jgi:aryl-alcohol dehydrogenase-like predicted oxidoreductase
MKQRTAGRTGLSLSELGLGCSSFWAKPVFPEARALAVVEAALANGITFFDTGPSYSAGNAERRLGMALRAHGVAKGISIATKVGTHVSPAGRYYKDWSPAAVRESVWRSLDRLGRPRIDILHLHGPAASDLTPELLESLEELRRSGVVGFLGINSFDEDVVRAGLRLPIFDSFMIEFNVMKKRNAALIEDIAAAERAVLVGTPVAQALFAGAVLPTSTKGVWSLLRAVKNHRREFLAGRHYRFLNHMPGMTGAQAALSYVLRHPKVSTAIFGTTDVRHLEQNVAAAAMTLPSVVLDRIARQPDA